MAWRGRVAVAVAVAHGIAFIRGLNSLEGAEISLTGLIGPFLTINNHT